MDAKRLGGISIDTKWVAIRGKGKSFEIGKNLGVGKHRGVVFLPSARHSAIASDSKLNSAYDVKLYLPTGSNIFAIRPFGRARDWNLIACTRLLPLYNNLWFVPGREMGRTVPSIKQKQLSSAAPFLVIAFKYSCIDAGLRISSFH